MTEAIITVENLGKKYRIRHQADRQRYTALRDVLTDKSKSIAQRLWSTFRSPSSALRPLSSVLRPPSSAPRLPPSVLRPPSSLL